MRNVEMVAIHPLVKEYYDIEIQQREKYIADLKEIVERQHELLEEAQVLIEEGEERLARQDVVIGKAWKLVQVLEKEFGGMW